MKLSPNIITLIEKRMGHALQLPSDCEFLALDIESRLGERVGATTLKRLIGFAADERTPHESTLRLLARYLGYSSWDELLRIEQLGNSGFDSLADEVRSADVPVGATVQVSYLPDRTLSFLHLGDGHYRVTESQNSKLAVDDEVTTQCFVLHHPLFLSDVRRGGESLGQFSAGRVSGLASITVIN